MHNKINDENKPKTLNEKSIFQSFPYFYRCFPHKKPIWKKTVKTSLDALYKTLEIVSRVSIWQTTTNSQNMTNFLWMYNIRSFLPFFKLILSKRIRYSFRALNSSSNDYVNLFFKWILILNKNSSDMRNCFSMCHIPSSFSIFSPIF